MKRVIGPALFLALLLPPSAANAGEPNTPPEVVELNAYENLYIRTVVLSGSTSRPLTASGAGCSWRISRRTATFGIGGDLAWWVQIRGDWCWGAGGNVKSVSWNKAFAIGDHPLNTWEWVRWEGTVTGGGVGTQHVYRRVKGHLKSCVIISFGTWCDHKEPWVALTLRGDGTAAASSGT